MKSSPMQKRVGRNVSLPFYIDLWLRDKFKATECSAYLVKLICSHIKEVDNDFYKEFKNEFEITQK